MTKVFFLILFLSVLQFSGIHAQDIIMKTNGDELEVKVLEVNTDDVKYRKFNNQSGPVYVLLNADIFMIKYENGEKDMFVKNESTGKVSVHNGTVPEPVQEKQTIVKAEIQKKAVDPEISPKELAYYNKAINNKKYNKQQRYIGLITTDELLYKIVQHYNYNRNTAWEMAFNKINDQELLYKLLMDAGFPQNGTLLTNTLNKITNEELLCKIALEKEQLSRLAATKINNEELLYQIAQNKIAKNSFVNYKDIVSRIRNQELLYELIKINKNTKTALETSVGRISDPEILKKLTDPSIVMDVRIDAIKKIDDQSFLYQLSLTEKDQQIITTAFNVMHEEMLQKIVSDSSIDYKLRSQAFDKIKDENFIFTLMNDKEFRQQAFNKINNQQYLYSLLNDKEYSQKAISKINDQDLLVKVVLENKEWEIRNIAFNKLDDASLKRVAAGAPKDKAPVIAAKIILNETTWEKEFSNSSSAYLSWVIGAAALVKTNQPTSASVIKACHTYIRRGDRSRIPELRTLLLRYGDKSLAEDYLNCGNDQLYSAAVEWGRLHGYNIGSGYGSHRVTWGSGG